VVAVIGSAIAATPQGWPSTATNRAVAPEPRSSSARLGRKVAHVDMLVGHQLRVGVDWANWTQIDHCSDTASSQHGIGDQPAP